MKVKTSWRFILVSLVLLVGIGSTQGGVYPDWTYRMKIRAAGYNQAETLTNFPTLVILSTNIPGFLYTDFNSSSNGADLRFAASNETTELNYEIEKWDTSGNSYVWVQIPTMSTTNDYIYAYWGNSASVPACTTNGSAWSENFAGVWHMDPSLGSPFRDASVNGNNGANGNSLDIAGVIANGRDFSQSDYMQVPDANSLDLTSAVTIEAWVKLDSYPTEWNVIAIKGDAGSTRDYGIFVRNTGDLLISCLTQSGGHHCYPAGQGFTLGVWHHITGLIDTSINRMAVFIDGQQKGVENSQNLGALLPNSEPLRFADVANAYPCDGKIDEIRISYVARSTNWINTSWLNQASNSAFLAFSDVGAQSTSLAVRANSVTGLGSTQATMGGRVLQMGNAENPYVYLCWGYSDGGTNATSAWTHVEALGTNWGVNQSFSTNITGLLSGSNYSYRCYVTNSTAYDWSDTAVSFQTLTLPIATNLGANAIAGQIATLRGQITATGGEAPSTWFLYWLDGSATTTTVAKGTQSGVFTTALSGLQIGSTYGYRCVASNGAGVVASEDRNFQTSASEYIWSGAGADNNASTPGNWVQGVAPTHPSDLIRLDNTSSKDMTWDLSNTVVAWAQTADYTGTVAIAARYDGTLPGLFVSGDCQVLGGKWTHPANGAAETYRLRASIGGNLTIGSGVAIDVTGKGYGQGQGPGHGDGGAYGPGASYGGMGESAISSTYGSIASPTNLGSGGLRSGGGAVLLQVNGSTLLAGSILAKGGSSEGYEGDSGGSVFLTTGDLAGNGVIDASGNADCLSSSGGGGGRIAVILTSSSSFGSVAMKAYGGKSGAAAGTVYLQTSTQSSETGTLILNNGGLSGVAQTLVTPAQSNLNTFSALIITNKAVLGLNTNTALNLGSANLFTYGPSQSFIATRQTVGMQLPPTWQLQNCTLQIYTNLEVPGSLTITNASLEMFLSGETNIHIGADLVIKSGGVLTHGVNGSTEAYRLALWVDGNLTIDASGAIDVTGKGFGGGQGPGRGSGDAYGPGASYGGMGGTAISTTYGSITSPTNLGSGGIRYGGGAVLLHVNGTTSLAGSILAKGGSSEGYAGDTGGSIFLTTGELAGNGAIDASANADCLNSNGGGGGRIAVILTGPGLFGSVAIKAYGGRSGAAAGTVYLQTSAQASETGTLIIDNGGLSGVAQTLVTPAQSNLNAFSSIIITNKGVLGLNSNTLLNLGNPVNLAVYGPAQSLMASPQTAGLQLVGDWTLSGYALQLYTNLDISGNLVVSNGTLEMIAGWQTNVHVSGNVTVANGGLISHGGNGAVEQNRLNIQVDGDLTIAAGGSIDVTGKGYGNSQGPGRGNGQNHNWHAAASHGGLGGYPESDPIVNFADPAFYVPFWKTYGSFTTPTNLGSGGMVSGGGAISLDVNGDTSLQGSLIAKGLDIWASGAAGGSILLITRTLTGNGVINASAGASEQCGGGGGRIAVKLTSGNSFGTVSLRAFGGASRKGAAGTIYCETADAGVGRGTLTVFGDATPYRTDTITAIPSTNAPMAELLSLKYVTLVATNYANVSLLTNLTMGNLFLRNDNAMLRLNGNTLTLKAVYHADWGTTNRVVYAGGEIIWDPGQGTVFTIR